MNYIDKFLEYLTIVKKHSSNTINSYKTDLIEFNEFVKGNLLSTDKSTVNEYLSYLYNENVSPRTTSRKLSALRSFYNYLLKENIVSTNYFKSIKNPKKSRDLPKYVKEDDIDKMFTIPDTRTWIGERNLAILRLLYASGLRVSELTNVKLNDINMSERTIRVLGKGSKERIVIFGYHAKAALDDYINRGRRTVDIHNSPYVFLNKDGNKLSTRYIRKIIDDIIIKASIKVHVTPHMFRHTFATSMLANGADLVSVKDLLGHSSLNTTSIYTHISNEQIIEIYNNAHPRAKF